MKTGEKGLNHEQFHLFVLRHRSNITSIGTGFLIICRLFLKALKRFVHGSGKGGIRKIEIAITFTINFEIIRKCFANGSCCSEFFNSETLPPSNGTDRSVSTWKFTLERFQKLLMESSFANKARWLMEKKFQLVHPNVSNI
jgi:hypothetical protein